MLEIKIQRLNGRYFMKDQDILRWNRQNCLVCRFHVTHRLTGIDVLTPWHMFQLMTTPHTIHQVALMSIQFIAYVILHLYMCRIRIFNVKKISHYGSLDGSRINDTAMILTNIHSLACDDNKKFKHVFICQINAQLNLLFPCSTRQVLVFLKPL